jgi:hypothetical protein
MCPTNKEEREMEMKNSRAGVLTLPLALPLGIVHTPLGTVLGRRKEGRRAGTRKKGTARSQRRVLIAMILHQMTHFSE